MKKKVKPRIPDIVVRLNFTPGAGDSAAIANSSSKKGGYEIVAVTDEGSSASSSNGVEMTDVRVSEREGNSV